MPLQPRKEVHTERLSFIQGHAEEQSIFVRDSNDGDEMVRLMIIAFAATKADAHSEASSSLKERPKGDLQDIRT